MSGMWRVNVRKLSGVMCYKYKRGLMSDKCQEFLLCLELEICKVSDVSYEWEKCQEVVWCCKMSDIRNVSCKCQQDV